MEENNKYFAAKKPKDLASNLMYKAEKWYNHQYTIGYIEKMRNSWSAYEGVFGGSYSTAHNITFAGEQGELVELKVNHYNNIANHIMSMLMSSRPAFQARAANTDAKSSVQTKLANALLDYYLREKRLEKHLEQAVKQAVVLGTGYIKMTWNAMAGEVGDVDEDGRMLYEGDVEFTNLSPFDVVFDSNKESGEHDWVICRSFKNKYDVIAKFPELEEKILSLPTKNQLFRFNFSAVSEDTEDIPIYEFFHRKTESMPEGRYMLYLDSDIWLMDTPLPYRSIPLFRISPGNIIGTPYGSSPMFQLLPLQEAVNSLYSTIITNQFAFGVQNVYVTKNSDITLRSLDGGLNLIEGAPGTPPPQALNLTNTPKEIFDFLQKLETEMERISGINSVVRGNPEASLKSGTALAMVQSTALQFISPLQQAYIRLLEDIGTSLINMLKDYATVPRVAIIAGKANKAFVEQEFKGDDLNLINRVIVEVGNPLSNTTAGKLEIASQLLQYQLLSSPQQYFAVLNTGNLDHITDDVNDELINIKKENEFLLSGKAIKAFALDQHALHIKQHRSVISDPNMRLPENVALANAVSDHIMEHIQLLQDTDPAILAIIGEQSLQPANPPQQPIPPEEVNTTQTPEMGMMGQPNMLENVPMGKMPPMPTPPPPFEGAPLTPEAAMQQQIQG